MESSVSEAEVQKQRKVLIGIERGSAKEFFNSDVLDTAIRIENGDIVLREIKTAYDREMKRPFVFVFGRPFNRDRIAVHQRVMNAL